MHWEGTTHPVFRSRTQGQGAWRAAVCGLLVSLGHNLKPSKKGMPLNNEPLWILEWSLTQTTHFCILTCLSPWIFISTVFCSLLKYLFWLYWLLAILGDHLRIFSRSPRNISRLDLTVKFYQRCTVHYVKMTVSSPIYWVCSSLLAFQTAKMILIGFIWRVHRIIIGTRQHFGEYKNWIFKREPDDHISLEAV